MSLKKETKSKQRRASKQKESSKGTAKKGKQADRSKKVARRKAPSPPKQHVQPQKVAKAENVKDKLHLPEKKVPKMPKGNVPLVKNPGLLMPSTSVESLEKISRSLFAL